ncbi:hypothetical protein F66182_750 [Fusarium sp. NRRL 66182]|nr:hypothetical protein F66182_750 [Fusarium sp. NRRL 66182]
MEIIPVPWFDQPNPIPTLRTRTFFIINYPLDADVLHAGLDHLIRIHWRKLGSRLVWSRQRKRLEYHLPHNFEDDHVLFRWSLKAYSKSIHAVQELSTITSPTGGIAFLPSMDAIDKLARPSDWPFERKDEPPNSPLLYVHLTNFNDATIVAMSCPHTLADQHGVANIVKAWLSVVQGRAPPEMVGYKDDVLGQERFSSEPKGLEPRTGRMRLRGKRDQVLVGGGFARDLLEETKEESHIVFIPIELIQHLRAKARRDLANNDELAEDISNGDIVTAVLTKFVRMHQTREYNICLSQVINLRGRIPELEAEKGEGFVHNSLHYATASFRISPCTPLREIAFQNRKAVIKGLQQEDIEAGQRVLCKVAKSGQSMLICEPHHRVYNVSNWCRAWQGIDFSIAAVTPNSDANETREPLVLGQGRPLRNMGRCERIDEDSVFIETDCITDSTSIMCRTKRGFWCDFAAPIKSMKLIKEYLAQDPALENL